MRVYIEAAAREHHRSNVLTEIMFAPALQRAQELDAEFEKSGKIVGPRKFQHGPSSRWGRR